MAVYEYECICNGGTVFKMFAGQHVVMHASMCTNWNRRKAREFEQSNLTGIEKHWRQQEEIEQAQAALDKVRAKYGLDI